MLLIPWKCWKHVVRYSTIANKSLALHKQCLASVPRSTCAVFGGQMRTCQQQEHTCITKKRMFAITMEHILDKQAIPMHCLIIPQN
uniref:Uncharacterized protein n=1 Tax=Rhizophora mucronata TaxID=61149 RepID=A0A2P2MWI9_RHIMU